MWLGASVVGAACSHCKRPCAACFAFFRTGAVARPAARGLGWRRLGSAVLRLLPR